MGVGAASEGAGRGDGVAVGSGAAEVRLVRICGELGPKSAGALVGRVPGGTDSKSPPACASCAGALQDARRAGSRSSAGEDGLAGSGALTCSRLGCARGADGPSAVAGTGLASRRARRRLLLPERLRLRLRRPWEGLASRRLWIRTRSSWTQAERRWLSWTIHARAQVAMVKEARRPSARLGEIGISAEGLSPVMRSMSRLESRPSPRLPPLGMPRVRSALA